MIRPIIKEGLSRRASWARVSGQVIGYRRKDLLMAQIFSSLLMSLLPSLISLLLSLLTGGLTGSA